MKESELNNLVASKIIDFEDIIKVYDFAVGTVFQITKTSNLPREEMELYKVDRNKKNWVSEGHSKQWRLPQLSEFRALIEILAHKKKLNEIDTRSTYWLSDSDGPHNYCLARIRMGQHTAHEEQAHLTSLATVAREVNEIHFSIDVYNSYLQLATNYLVKALPIMTHHGEADAMWHIDDKAIKKQLLM